MCDLHAITAMQAIQPMIIYCYSWKIQLCNTFTLQIKGNYRGINLIFPSPSVQYLDIAQETTWYTFLLDLKTVESFAYMNSLWDSYSSYIEHTLNIITIKNVETTL